MNKILMAHAMVLQAKIALSEFKGQANNHYGEQPSSMRVRSLIEIGIDEAHRADCLANYDAALAYLATFLPEHAACCAALALHSEGAQQRLMVGTLANYEPAPLEPMNPFDLFAGDVA